jgi:hypothetical protein
MQAGAGMSKENGKSLLSLDGVKNPVFMRFFQE